MSKTANIIAACGVLVTGIGALPGLVGMARGEGAAQPYRNLLGSAGEAPATEPTETVDLTARELEPATPSAPVAVAAPPAPIGPDGVPMQRLAQDPRLSMRVVAATPYPDSVQLMTVRFELTSTGGDSLVFADHDGLQQSWGLDGDHAGHCWQQRQSGLAEFNGDRLATEEPTWLAAGASVSITGTYQCATTVVVGDVFTATTRPMLVSGQGIDAAARPIQFRSPPFIFQ